MFSRSTVFVETVSSLVSTLRPVDCGGSWMKFDAMISSDYEGSSHKSLKLNCNYDIVPEILLDNRILPASQKD